MTLREWLGNNQKVKVVDYTYIAKDGKQECNYVTREDILLGSWEVPSGIANCEVVKSGTEKDGEYLIGFVTVNA